MEEDIKPIDILLVEDNNDDIFLIKKVFQKMKFVSKLYIVHGGKEALDFIFHRNKYAETKPDRPGLILLDINMPEVSGFDVLKTLKAEPRYKDIPIIMLTSSNSEEDIAKSYEDGACSYIAKPLNFNDFVKVISQFELYWALTFAKKKPPEQDKN